MCIKFEQSIKCIIGYLVHPCYVLKVKYLYNNFFYMGVFILKALYEN